MGEIDTVWERLEAEFARQGCESLNSGATPEQLDKLQQYLGLELPSQLRESLLRHNGTPDFGWPQGVELLSTEGIAIEARVWRELLEDGSFGRFSDHDASYGTGETKPGWWQRGWIPLTADGGGNGWVVDADPGPNGQPGQILYMDNELGPGGPHHPDLASWLTEILDGIDDGPLVRDANGSWKEG